jgi:hypothetical protein
MAFFLENAEVGTSFATWLDSILENVPRARLMVP